MNKQLIENIKKSIIFIGAISKDSNGNLKENIQGTGSIIKINGLNYLLTAKHVVFNKNTNTEIPGLSVFPNMKEEKSITRAVSLDDLKKENLNFIFHKNSDIDVALIPIALNIETDDFLVNQIEYSKGIKDLIETDEVFYIGYQPGISSIFSDVGIKPIVRKGNIARVNNDKTYYIDGFVFPGNSGSPIFIMPKYFKENQEGISVGTDIDAGKIIGVVNGYKTFQDTAVSQQTSRARIIFEENMGLSIASSIDIINEIIESEAFKKQEETINKKLENEQTK